MMPLATFAQTQLGEIVFLTRLPREVFVALLLLAAGGMWLLYRRSAGKLSRNARWVLIGLRTAFFALLLVLLAIPALQKPRSRSGELFTAVVVDSSQSMSIADVVAGGQKLSRFDAEKQLLEGAEGKGGLLGKIAQSSQVVTFAFDQDLRRVTKLADLRPTGPYTNLFRSIRDLDTELRGAPLASVVLLTDGNVRKSDSGKGGSADDAAEILKARGVPLHIVGLGDPRPPRDYEVVRVFAPRKVRRNSEVEIFATVRNTDYRQPFEVRVSRGDTVLTAKTVQPIEGTDLQRIGLKLTPDHEGPATYSVSIPPAPGEAVTANNSKEFTLEIADDRLPVLYLEGSPRLEYRFLRRVMFRDPDFRVVGVLRLAHDRFYVQGANEGEQYLQQGFPDTPDRLFAFKAVILGDIEASYFKQNQLDLLEQFVRERGGGVLMLGGVNSFGLGKYAGTPLAKMLPLEISPLDGRYSDERYNARITEEGRKHPVMRLSPDAEANRHLWDTVPPLVGLTPVKGPKLGGQVLLAQEGSGRPVLAVQNYGQGRVGAFTSGGSWYWQVSMPADDEFQEKFWKQFIRWLVVGAREQLTLQTDQDVYARRDPVTIRATVSGKDLKPINNATVVATVTDPLGNARELTMDQLLSQEGAYQARYEPEDEGAYTVSVRVDGWSASEKPPQTEFRVSEPLVEFNDAGLKEDVLRNMARLTGGRYYALADAGQLPEELEKTLASARTAGIEPQRTPIWDHPLLLALLLTLAGAEWLVRRRAGLA